MSGGSTSPNSMMQQQQQHMVRKCLGKKQSECVQGDDHLCTRWECAFETQNKDEFHKHSKNISKRVKWRELVSVETTKAEKDGWYRCVYYSTDRHHVENHYQKGSNDALSPSPSQIMRYKNYYLQQSRGYTPSPSTKPKGKRWVNSNGGSKREMDDDEEEGNISPEVAAREYKKLRQDASLLGFFQENHGNPEGAEGKEGEHMPGLLPDQMKTEDLVDMIEKRLELSHDMCQIALDKLLKNGFVIVAGLKGLKKEAWEKLDLPLAIEEELKNQINISRAYNPWMYGMPFWGFPQNNQWGNYYGMGQGAPPMYIPGVNPDQQEAHETHESVIGEGEIEAKTKKEEKDGDLGESDVHHHHHHHHLGNGPSDNPSAPLVSLSSLVDSEKKDSMSISNLSDHRIPGMDRLDSQEEHQKKLMMEGWGGNAYGAPVVDPQDHK